MRERIKEYLHHSNAALVVLFVVFWAPVVVFLKIAGEIIEDEPIPLDTAILQWLHGYASPWLDTFFLGATNLGSVTGIIVMSIMLLAYLLYKKQRKNSLLLVAGVGGAATANLILKALFQRDRPSLFDSSVIEASFSFPSGHAMASAALALCVILIFWHTKWRWPAGCIAALTALVISISRLYFGVHYPTDIVAGWCASAAWVIAVLFVITKLRLRINPTPRTSLQ